MTDKRYRKEGWDAPKKGFCRWSVHIRKTHLEYLKQESERNDMSLKDVLDEIIGEDIEHNEGKSNS
jgi:hypothetical protein